MIEIDHLLKDEPVRAELAAIVGTGRPLPKGAEWNVSAAMVENVIARAPGGREPGSHPYTEAVIREFMRPVLLVRNDRIELATSSEIRKRLAPTRALLEARLPSVGRLEFVGHPQLRWGGTGWVIAENVVVTNRHVAEMVARRVGRRFSFKVNVLSGDTMGALVDFREEYSGPGAEPTSLEVRAKKILFVEQDDERLPDVALIELERSDDVPAPIPLASDKARDDSDIGVVGYPARDPRGIPSEAAAHKIFGELYEVKRFSPGKVLVADAGPWYFTHDATTLGGNSGSVVLDITTGSALGLHFMGELSAANYAVNARTLVDYLSKFKLHSKATIAEKPAKAGIGAEAVIEAPVADYDSRVGFDSAFLGKRARVSLPTKTAQPRDLLFFGPKGARESELRYTHFSLAMSRRRKLCLWSAVNIEGASTRKAKRAGWRLDPRIPRDAQTSGEVYGNEPQFARGHMTRREDPIWGPEPDALLGNADSMHLTNAVPQMQPFNAGIWNGLEDYALLNAREDLQRISVLTGPVLADSDPVMFGVQVPVEFWKVIAFIHDGTGKLTATGYLMTQESFLGRQEFVYGQHETFQIAISAIERKAGLKFGSLSSRDPLHGGEEAVPAALTAFEQIALVDER